ncbi:ETX/MTX2 family pore-forming toxin [Spiroplasma sp. ChiS]|uniref:ETX/MTX2 family pore-forming toxin n=1 Tax=Spiroplasma sp. ChiS TaxID=2099885 RepID=UPI001392257B|nr:ETX/MTX2 family pore-forming toxin [Spiroplasma sp. ChiS]
MKKLLSLVGTSMLATSPVAPLVANTKYQPSTEESISSEDKVEITQEKNGNDELPIPNVGNWDLSTGPGYFEYFWYCLNYLHNLKDPTHKNNIDPNEYWANKASSPYCLFTDSYWWDENEQQNWVEQGKGIINIPKITNEKKDELDHAHDALINKTDEAQNLSTSSYTHQQTVGNSLTLGAKISTTFEINAIIENTKLTAEISASGTWTDTVTDTYNATTQKINVPAHSEIDVDYFFYKTVDQVDTWVYQKYNTDQYLYLVIPYEGDNVACNLSVQRIFDMMKQYENTDWIFNILNGYVKKFNGDFYIKTLPISYKHDGTEFDVVVFPAKPALNQ